MQSSQASGSSRGAEVVVIKMNGKRSSEADGEQPRKRSRFDKPAGSTDPATPNETQQSQQNGAAAKPLPSLSALDDCKEGSAQTKRVGCQDGSHEGTDHQHP